MRPSFAIFFVFAALGADTPLKGEEAKSVVKVGRVMTFAEAMEGRGIAFDREPVAKQMVLKADDGSVSPLLSDDASRALFLDERVRNRKAELKVREPKGLPYLQVLTFRVEMDGALRTPEYYCEICSISVRYPQDCPCCQGPLIFRMKPQEP